jgi:hypothetical protein
MLSPLLAESNRIIALAVAGCLLLFFLNIVLAVSLTTIAKSRTEERNRHRIAISYITGTISLGGFVIVNCFTLGYIYPPIPWPDQKLPIAILCISCICLWYSSLEQYRLSLPE